MNILTHAPKKSLSAVESREQIIERLLENRNELAGLGVKTIGLFGSFVHGNSSADSDVDFLVEFHPEKHSFDNFMELSFLLEHLMGRKVEVVTPESLSPYIGAHILREVENVVIAA